MIEEKYLHLIEDGMVDECINYSLKDSFIGQRFGEKGQIEVLGWFGKKAKNNAKYYKVICHECAKNKHIDLPIFDILKDNLNKGRKPCLCSRNPKNIPEGTLLKMFKEKVEDDGRYTIASFSDHFNKEEVTAELYCSLHGNFKINSVNRYLKQPTKCPVCNQIEMNNLFTKDFETAHISDFMNTGNFLEGTVFKQSETKFYRVSNSSKNIPYIEITCPVCSNDEFVQAGLCSGVFYGRQYNLKHGNLPCRCSGKFKWTTAQRELQIKKIMTEEDSPLVFVGWKDSAGYKTYKSRINLECKIHGVFDVAIDNFLQGYTRCPCCSGRGFNRNIESYFYIVKWELDSLVFYKLGITNDVSKRIKTQNQRNKKLRNTVCKVLKFPNGITPLKLESFCKSKLNLRYVSQDVMPDGHTETFEPHMLQTVLELVEQFLADSNENLPKETYGK